MSMIANFVAVTDEDFAHLRENPGKIESFLYPDEEFALIGIEQISIDKAWHVIHFILTGTDWGGPEPQREAILGGEPFGENLGYGPARFLAKDRVKQVSAHLETLSSNLVSENFNLKAFADNGIYPNIWSQLEGEHLAGVDFFDEYFQLLRDFYRRAAESNLNVVQYLDDGAE
jgi:hypothetical protein